MRFENEYSIERSRWSDPTSRTIDLLCLLVLSAVVCTVIYGFALRAIWAHGYYVAVAIAILGALTLTIGLAQQAIAARDAATWRSMAVWQLRAAQNNIQNFAEVGDSETILASDPDAPDYYEQLLRVFLESIQRTNEDVTDE